ncbi:cellulose synthase [Erwinia typographi]|uniref:Cellulose synthase n=1 Tax=Erwinia typographi TaxID=371042 RepID=A0A0A3Z7N8_9GAMM|nr:cellulose synthase subunit BcsC-related outer membrane protein [Erwinia typographi]KGT95067.1 cellulose synthase [Erwinia typographi]
MKRSLLSLVLPVLLLPLSRTVPAAGQVEPVDWLLQQVRIGEASNKYDLVSQSLYRLEKIAPDNPQVLAAQIRLALYQGDRDKARQLLATLQQRSPDSLATRQAEASIRLLSEAGRQQLQQARLLATSGHLAEARAAYDKQFNGVFPSGEIALEYWRLVARLPGQQTQALAALSALESAAPGSINLRMAIARMEMSRNNPAAALKQLQAVAADPAGRVQAAELWLSSIKSQPVTPQSVAQLNVYLKTFTSDKPQADGLAELARQQKLLAEPAYQQRLRGLMLTDRGQSASAIPSLRAALKATPDDPDLLGAMGLALSRANNRQAANGYFQRAIVADAQGTDIGKWRSLLHSNQYWLAIAQGDKALATGDTVQASRYYQLARRLDSRDGYALIGLGDVALAQNKPATAEALFRGALRVDPSNTTASRRLAALYQQQSAQKAIAFINGLSAAQQRALGETLSGLHSRELSDEGDRLADAGNGQQAAEKYRQALHLSPQDVWLNYRLARALRQAGQPQVADNQMLAMARQQPEVASQVYANALYLSGSGRPEEALARLYALPAAKWDQSIRDLNTRLETDRTIERAEALRAQGGEAQAIVLLGTLPDSSRRTLLLADWALARGDSEEALRRYRQVKKREPQHPDASLGEIEALVALNQLVAARQRLSSLPPEAVTQSVNSGRRVANAWLAVGEPQKAAALYAALKPLAAREGASQSSKWLYRDAAELTRQQDSTLTLEEDYSRNKGTGGVSDFTAHTTMMEAATPFAQGKGFLRLDNVDVSAGRFSRSSSGTIEENFGTCANNDAVCNRDFRQHQNGTSIGLGYRSDRWSADIGTTPLGFAVTNWVGGVTWHTDWRDLGLSLTASRRPISSSLLSWAGTRDPNLASGKTWGGVVATGGALGISYDQGNANGVWADLSAHQITGENVADNSRQRLMAGYYYKLINEDNRRATVGLNGMLWHYAKDLSDYSLGQGGYYSPQSYGSLSIPVSWRQRSDNWSYDLGASVAWSRAKTRAQPRYPLDFGSLTSDNPLSSDSRSSGFGYTLRAVVERRLTAHWTLGAGLDIQQAKDYTPSHALIFARYSMAGWEGDLDMPPVPLSPYADFK